MRQKLLDFSSFASILFAFMKAVLLKHELDALNGQASATLTHTNDYQYTIDKPHAVTKAGNMLYTYDANGNMLTRENTKTKAKMTLVWDNENRLKQSIDTQYTTDYRYDANGERILKSSDMGELEYVSASYVVRNGTIVSKHIFAGNGRVASTVGNLTDNGNTTTNRVLYYHPDHLGSSSYVTDRQGRFYEAIEYLPYGETLFNERTESDGVSYKYTGKEEDAETGLYYYGARYYDAKLCRWLSVDPILEKYLPSGNKDRDKNLPGMGGVFNCANLNLYHYAGNNPVQYIDPDGNSSACATWTATMPWLVILDGPIPVGDIVYVGGIAVTGGIDVWMRYGPVLMSNADKIPAAVDQARSLMRDLSNSGSSMPDPNQFDPKKFDISSLKSKIDQLSKNNIKHIQKHVGDFQKIDPEMNLEKVIGLGEKITRAENYIGSPGGRPNFQAAVEIAGKKVNVRAVYDTANNLRSVFIKEVKK